MKLGQPVTITQYYDPVCTWNVTVWDIKHRGIVLEPDLEIYKINRYVPVECEIKGIITGYKKITPSTVYKKYDYEEYDYENDTGAETLRTKEGCKFVSSERESVYVVQTSLTKKYFVKKEWIEVA